MLVFMCCIISLNIVYDIFVELYNDTLLYQKDLDEEFVDMLLLFLKRHEEPLCLVAHNGYRFDFPLLQSELASINRSLPEGILCIDSLTLYLDLDAASPNPAADVHQISEWHSYAKCDLDLNRAIHQQETPTKLMDIASNGGIPKDKLSCDSIRRKLVFDDVAATMSHSGTQEATGRNEIWLNETSTESELIPEMREGDSGRDEMGACSVSDTILSNGESSDRSRQVRAVPSLQHSSYKLADLCRRFLGHDPCVCHRAEDDCITLLRIFHKTSDMALPWVNAHAVKFNSIQCMYNKRRRQPLDPGLLPYHL